MHPTGRAGRTILRRVTRSRRGRRLVIEEDATTAVADLELAVHSGETSVDAHAAEQVAVPVSLKDTLAEVEVNCLTASWHCTTRN